MTALPTLDCFLPWLNQALTVRIAPDLAVPLVLTKAEALEVVEYPGRTFDPFDLRFRGAHQVFLDQGIYPFEIPSFGLVDIFLVPLGHDDLGYIYQAVFH